MRIIAIQGPTSCGKTSTLNILYNLLINRGAIPSNRRQVGANPNDFEVILTLPGGKRVGIFTVGDLSGQLVQAIHHYSTLNLDDFVCACNLRFLKPPRLINMFAHVWFPKIHAPNPANRITENTLMAQQISNLI